MDIPLRHAQKALGAVLVVLLFSPVDTSCTRIYYRGPMEDALHFKHSSTTRVLFNHKIALSIDGDRLSLHDRKTGSQSSHAIERTFVVKGVRVFVLESNEPLFGVEAGDGILAGWGGFTTMLRDLDSFEIGPVVLLKEPTISLPESNPYVTHITGRITQDPDQRGRLAFENLVIHEMTHVIFMDSEFIPKEGTDEYRLSEAKAVLSEMVYGHTLVSFEGLLTQKYYIDLAEEMSAGLPVEEDAPWVRKAQEVSEILDLVMVELGIEDADLVQYFSEEDLRAAAAEAMDQLCLDMHFSPCKSLINPSVYEEALALSL
jgi:hypothetical protein